MSKKYTKNLMKVARRNYKHLKKRKDLTFSKEILHLCCLAASGMGETWLIYEIKYNGEDQLTKHL